MEQLVMNKSKRDTYLFITNLRSRYVTDKK